MIEQALLLALCAPLFFFFPLPSSARHHSHFHGFNCSSDRALYPCKSYAFYIAGADSSLLDLSSIGDLFGVSRLSIARASNLSSDTSAVASGQPLFIPLLCSCISNRSFFPVDYQIHYGDTFYHDATFVFSNLTTYAAIEDANPLLNYSKLHVGAIATFPIFCQCPENRSEFLVTYALQPSDSFASLASRFGSDAQTLMDLNAREGSLIHPFSQILIPVSRIPPFSIRMTMPSSPPARRGHPARSVLKLSVSLGVMGLLCALLLICWISSQRCRVRRFGKDLRSVAEKKPTLDISEWLDKYRLFEIGELRAATAGFDDSRLIGGSVYRGEIDGELHAFKMMKWNASDELKILQKVNHANLARLEGFCVDPERSSSNGCCCCWLVYEYVPNGSLHDWLRDPALSLKLGWRSRLRIALDVAHGLEYIHEHAFPRVAHKDIKSRGVLLDNRLRAKIANFAAGVTGTDGYIPPERTATTKADVFAYGVLMLELLTGREAAAAEGGRMLWEEAEANLFGHGEIVQMAKLARWMDPVLAGQSCPADGLLAAASIARACLQRDPQKRPGMVDVAYALTRADDMPDFSMEAVMGIVGSDAGAVVIAR